MSEQELGQSSLPPVKGTIVEKVARALAMQAGHDPDEAWEEYDRNAAHSAAAMDYPEGWEKEAFPETVRWREFISPATAAIESMPIQKMVEGLERCRDKFREYEGLHLAKLTETYPPAEHAAVMEKVQRNREMADQIDSLLASVRSDAHD